MHIYIYVGIYCIYIYIYIGMYAGSKIRFQTFFLLALLLIEHT